MNREFSRCALGGWLVLAGLPGAHAQGIPELHWDPGAETCDASKQLTQLQAIDPVTIVIRQNPCVDFEAPLMYLLIGTEKALLIDSGASDDPRITGELVNMVGSYLHKPDGGRLPLVVAHTHGHQDHRSGDAAFAASPQTTVVPADGAGMRRFFKLEDWPNQWAQFDLGGRDITLMPTPGHHEDHVVFYDPRTKLLFTGDFLLPGRLLVDDIKSYAPSAGVLSEFVHRLGITQALGAHIEMDASGELYASGATWHPDERQIAVPFDLEHAVQLRKALFDFNGFYSRHEHYVIVNPVHNLIALAAGVLVAVGMLVWFIRRLRRQLKARRAVAAG